MKKTLLSTLVIILLGCYTPSGKLTKADFHWSAKEVKMNYQEAYRRMYRGITSEGVWIVEGNLYSELGNGMMDLYGKKPFGGRHDLVNGRIQVTKITDSVTLVEFGINNSFPNSSRHRQWREKYFEYLEVETKQ